MCYLKKIQPPSHQKSNTIFVYQVVLLNTPEEQPLLNGVKFDNKTNKTEWNIIKKRVQLWVKWFRLHVLILLVV